MADGLNHKREERTLQVIGDWHALQHQIVHLGDSTHFDEQGNLGYQLLQECISESFTIANSPSALSPGKPPAGSEEEKTYWQQALLDATARRFLAQTVYLKAIGAISWLSARDAALRDGSDWRSLQLIDTKLRTDRMMITDTRVFSDSQNYDRRLRRWMDEDPTYEAIRAYIATMQPGTA